MKTSSWARVTGRNQDPANFELVGVPPKDLVEEIAAALRLAGIDADSVFEKCVVVSGEWKYDTIGPWQKRFSQEYIRERTVPMKHKTVEETLNPQPVASRVLMRLFRAAGVHDEAGPPFRQFVISSFRHPGGDGNARH